MTTSEDRPSRVEIEREEAEDLLAWARSTGYPLPDDGDDPEAWAGVVSELRDAKYHADRLARRPVAVAVSDLSDEPEPF